MPYAYFVRITHAYENLRSLVSLWSMRCEKIVVYEHVGTQTEKVHCHILILGSNTQKKQLRNIGSTCVNLKGNEMCSFKDADEDYERACVYMTKGKLSPMFLKGFDSSDAELWKSKWVEPTIDPKISSAEKLYNEFESVMEDTSDYAPPVDCFGKDLDEFKFNYIKRCARSFAFSRNKFLWSQKFINDYKLLCMTYCMRRDIPIPSKHKFAEIL